MEQRYQDSSKTTKLWIKASLTHARLVIALPRSVALYLVEVGR